MTEEDEVNVAWLLCLICKTPADYEDAINSLYEMGLPCFDFRSMIEDD